MKTQPQKFEDFVAEELSSLYKAEIKLTRRGRYLKLIIPDSMVDRIKDVSRSAEEIFKIYLGCNVVFDEGKAERV